MSQPTSKATVGPNASRAYRYGPPVSSKRLPTSAKQRMISITTSAQATKAIRLYEPMSANTFDGKPNIPAPITALIATATRSHLRMPRSRPSGEVFRCVGESVFMNDWLQDLQRHCPDHFPFGISHFSFVI